MIVAKAFQLADPCGLFSAGFPADEYNPEIADIVRKIEGGREISLEMIEEVFVHWFGDFGGAEELYEALRRLTA